MKKSILISVLFSLYAGVSSADTASVNQLGGLGMSYELATRVDQLYGSAIQQNVLPLTTNKYNLGSSTFRWFDGYFNEINQTTGIITPLTTPASTFAPIAAIPTAAANAGGLMPIITPGDTAFICNKSANASTIWPQNNAAPTVTPGTILGFGTPVAAGTPASLPTGKCIECKGFDNATVPNTWYCNQGV